MTSENQPLLPLFYGSPQPLSASEHGSWRLKSGDVAFAADTPYIPVVVGEIAAASHHYPVVFAAGDSQPVALMGLDSNNLFVTEGRWAEHTYIPAYVRRYPFGFMATINPEGFVLAIDVASERVVAHGGEGVGLFDEGEPSDVTRQALQFCEAFQSEAQSRRAFADALIAQGLLIDRRADATLPDGRTLGLDGFQIVDATRFASMEDGVIAEWHRKGWLGLVHHHLASLEHFQSLLMRQGQRSIAQPVTEPTQDSVKTAAVPA